MSELLDELERLSKAATPGPWALKHKVVDDLHEQSNHKVNYYNVVSRLGTTVISCNWENADLKAIVLMRNHIDALIKVARAAEKCLTACPCDNCETMRKSLAELERGQ